MPSRYLLALAALGIGAMVFVAGFFALRPAPAAAPGANPPRAEVALDFRSSWIGKITGTFDRPLDRLTVRITHDGGRLTELPVGSLAPGEWKPLITTELTRASFEGIQLCVQNADGSLTPIPFLLIMDGTQSLQGGATPAVSSPRGE